MTKTMSICCLHTGFSVSPKLSKVVLVPVLPGSTAVVLVSVVLVVPVVLVGWLVWLSLSLSLPLPAEVLSVVAVAVAVAVAVSVSLAVVMVGLVAVALLLAAPPLSPQAGTRSRRGSRRRRAGMGAVILRGPPGRKAGAKQHSCRADGKEGSS